MSDIILKPQEAKEAIESLKTEYIKRSGVDEATFFTEASFALQAMQANSFLAKASKESLMKAVLNVAHTGLSLNPVSGYAYLVPRSVRKGQEYVVEAILEPGYKGLVKLLTDAGSVKHIETQLIYEGDEVEIDMADDRKVKKHIPYVLTGKPKGDIRAVYSKAILHDGSTHIEIMSRADIDGIRERSESYKAFKAGKTKTCIWETDYAEMVRKTVIKRHFKYLPKTDRLERFENALELEHEHHGFAKPFEWQQKNDAEQMINQYIPDRREAAEYKRRVDEAETYAEMDAINQELYERGNTGHETKYRQKDAMKQLDKAVNNPSK